MRIQQPCKHSLVIFNLYLRRLNDFGNEHKYANVKLNIFSLLSEGQWPFGDSLKFMQGIGWDQNVSEFWQ